MNGPASASRGAWLGKRRGQEEDDDLGEADEYEREKDGEIDRS